MTSFIIRTQSVVPDDQGNYSINEIVVDAESAEDAAAKAPDDVTVTSIEENVEPQPQEAPVAEIQPEPSPIVETEPEAAPIEVASLEQHEVLPPELDPNAVHTHDEDDQTDGYAENGGV